MIVGDAYLLRSGVWGTYVGNDEDSGWPIMEIPGQGLIPTDPVEIGRRPDDD